jgi:Xaa-Pro aminopeptidase
MHHSLQKLALVRSSMKTRDIDVLVVSDSDPHLQEYIPDNWRIIEWLTGFTGSSAILIISDSFAGLWTDSRYTLQAAKQLENSGFTLMEHPARDKTEVISWMEVNLGKGSTIGLDGRLFPVNRVRTFQIFAEKAGMIIDTGCDIISELWIERPQLPDLKVIDHHVHFCGWDRARKIEELRKEMKNQGLDYHLLVSPDEIMWLLNIRGHDVKYNPVLLSYAIVGMDQILLLTDESKISDELARKFDKLSIVLLPYEETAGIISTLEPGSTILISPSATSAALYNSVPQRLIIREDTSIVARMKAVKNEVEIRNIGNAMIKDGVALTKFFCWLEDNIGKKPLTELALTQKLDQLRSEQENFLTLSFSTIVAYNANAALPHYIPGTMSDAKIGNDGIMLADSGSHYLDGTTDITRTITIGEPSSRQIDDFTFVLKGMISLATVKFHSGNPWISS